MADLVFNLTTNDDVPAAYVDIVERPLASPIVRQVVVSISSIGFVARELIFDVAEDDVVVGVEIL